MRGVLLHLLPRRPEEAEESAPREVHAWRSAAGAYLRCFRPGHGLDTTYMTMTERHYTIDFHYQAAFQALCLPEHEQDEERWMWRGAPSLAGPSPSQWRLSTT
ncbi:unnamed protein product [Linum trigynum]|uniref:Uncharacterized protein n=1 Tax=Linum trigynum TaxID=586398 RepID=A0AAV2DAP4_9ROSI